MTYLIDIDNAVVSYPLPEGGEKTVLNNINLDVQPGAFLTVVGPSGCGKSTLLRLILGTQFPNQGSVLVDGKKVSRVTRDCGIVYQNYLLFPFLTVLDNIGFGRILEQTSLADRLLARPFRILEWLLNHLAGLLVYLGNLTVAGLYARKGLRPPSTRFTRSQGTPLWTRVFDRYLKFYRVRKEARQAAAELLASVGLDSLDGEKYPYELSGGMKQRVAIAQSIMMQPKILLLDEPFGALDAKTRADMQDFIHLCWQKHGLTVFFVTHDLDEAVKLGTRLICLSQYWCDSAGKRGLGARIVRDQEIAGGDTLPSQFHGTDEYQMLIANISKAGLNKSALIPEASFDLTHHDAYVCQPQEKLA
jgi:NitT/TauT family transport system ATP-binding protein